MSQQQQQHQQQPLAPLLDNLHDDLILHILSFLSQSDSIYLLACRFVSKRFASLVSEIITNYNRRGRHHQPNNKVHQRSLIEKHLQLRNLKCIKHMDHDHFFREQVLFLNSRAPPTSFFPLLYVLRHTGSFLMNCAVVNSYGWRRVSIFVHTLSVYSRKIKVPRLSSRTEGLGCDINALFVILSKMCRHLPSSSPLEIRLLVGRRAVMWEDRSGGSQQLRRWPQEEDAEEEKCWRLKQLELPSYGCIARDVTVLVEKRGQCMELEKVVLDLLNGEAAPVLGFGPDFVNEFAMQLYKEITKDDDASSQT